MASDAPKAPERVWFDPQSRQFFYDYEGPVEDTGWPMFIRADLAPVLPPPGSEAEAAAVERMIAAFEAVLNDPRMVDCPRCHGKGYGALFGAAMDHCDACSGNGEILADGEEARPMLAALRALAEPGERATPDDKAP